MGIDDQSLERFLAPGRGTRVIAHRGFSGKYPENTLAAFRAALELDPHMIELDVTRSSDGELVVIHDDTLDRTTDGKGPVLGRTLREIRALDAGSWFHPRFAAERVPTLADVLELVHGHTLVNVEFKEEALTDAAEGGIVEQVVGLLQAIDMRGDVLFSSFDPRALEHARAIAPDIARASLFDKKKHARMGPIEVMDAVEARAFNLGRKEVTAEIVDECHDHGRTVNVYTVNRLADMRRMIGMGVDGMFTDHPDRLRELLAG